MEQHETVQTLSLREYIDKMREEIMSPFNRWVAGISLGRDPSAHECRIHYILHGGPANLDRRYRVLR